MNKRLRKKKRVGEFQELGFEIEFDITDRSNDSVILVMENLISFVEDNKLSIGGGFNPRNGFCFFVAVLFKRGSCTEEHRKLIEDYLLSINVLNLKIGKLRDAWYGWKL